MKKIFCALAIAGLMLTPTEAYAAVAGLVPVPTQISASTDYKDVGVARTNAERAELTERQYEKLAQSMVKRAHSITDLFENWSDLTVCEYKRGGVGVIFSYFKENDEIGLRLQYVMNDASRFTIDDDQASGTINHFSFTKYVSTPASEMKNEYQKVLEMYRDELWYAVGPTNRCSSE